MKILPSGLQEHLDSGATTMCYCWEVTRKDDVVLGFTEHDNPLSFGGVDFLASTGFTASRINQTLGLAVDNLNIAGLLDSSVLTEDDLASGLYDNAGVTLYWVNWADIDQRIVVSRGTIGEVRREESQFSAEFRSLSQKLQQRTGRIYQRYCDAVLGDSRCKINLASSTYKGSGTVTSASGRSIQASGLDAYEGGWFTAGVITFTSGANDGLSFEVKGHGTTDITLWTLPFKPILLGDTFDITAGCQQDSDTCRVKFNNIVNFQGFPFIPGNDVMQDYPVRGSGGMDGGSLFK